MEQSDCVLEESDSEVNVPPVKMKKTTVGMKKWTGAATYKTKYNKEWQKKWPFVTSVKGDPHSFRCTACLRVISCAHMGERDIIRHAESEHHKKNSKSLEQIQRINFKPGTSSLPLQDKICLHLI